MDNGIKSKCTIILLGCKETDIMDERFHSAVYDTSAWLDHEIYVVISGTVSECQYYKDLIAKDEVFKFLKVFCDDQATDTLSNAKGIKAILKKEKIWPPIHCILSEHHMWRFKKCCKMVGLQDCCHEKIDLRFSTNIHEAKSEWIADIFYLFGPIGVKFSSWLTKVLR